VEMLALIEGMRGDLPPAVVAPGGTVSELRAQVQAAGGEPPSVRRAADVMSDSSRSSRPAAWTLSARLMRPAVRPLAIAAWTAASVRVEAHWEDDAHRLDDAAVLAAAPHRHWLDAFAIARALPWRLRRRLHLLVEHDFSEHAAADAGTPLRR